MSKLVIVSTLVAAAAILGACRKDVHHEPMKLGAADVVVTQSQK